MYRMLRRGPRRRPRPHLGAGLGLGRRRHAARAWPSGSRSWAPPITSRCSARVGQAAFVEGYGMVEVGGGVAAKVSPPFFGAGAGLLGEALGFALPGYDLRVVDDDGKELAAGQVGELQVKGPGVLAGLLGRRGGDRRRPHRGRLAAHRRPGPQGPARAARVRGPEQARDQARRLLRLRPRGRAGPRGAPDGARGGGGRSARRADGRGARGRGAPGAAARPSPPPTSTRGPRSASRTTRCPKRFVAVDELPRTGTTKVQKDALAVAVRLGTGRSSSCCLVEVDEQAAVLDRHRVGRAAPRRRAGR